MPVTAGAPWPGWAVAVGMLAAAGGALALLGGDADPLALWADPAVRRAAGFTLLQAGLSTALSCGLGVALARALHRRAPGRVWPRLLLGVAMVTPATVAALGVVAVWGRAGWLGDLGLPLYGLTGILLGHAFLNAPLVARIALAALEGVPPGRWRLAAQLGLGPRALWRAVEAPALARAVPGAAALVFLLCAASFALVLLLGGGPRATTLEIAIYQAARLDFDLGRAAGLAILQLMLGAGVLGVLALLPAPVAGAGAGAPVPRPDRGAWGGRATDAAALAIGALVIAAPLAALGTQAPGLARLAPDAAFWAACAASLGLGLATAALTTALGLMLARTRARIVRPGARLAFDLAAALPLALSASVLSLGAFVALRPWGDAFAWGPGVVLGGNVLMTLPFAAQVLTPRLAQIAARHDRQAAALGLTAWARFRLVEFPRARREIGFCAGLAAALSVGDLGVAAFFGTPGFATLPWLIFQTAGRYQTDLAGAMALALLLLALGLFAGLGRVIGGRRC